MKDERLKQRRTDLSKYFSCGETKTFRNSVWRKFSGSSVTKNNLRQKKSKFWLRAADHRGSIPASHSAALNSIIGVPKWFDAAELCHLCRLEESGPRLNNVNWTNLVPQKCKNFEPCSFYAEINATPYWEHITLTWNYEPVCNDTRGSNFLSSADF